MTQYISGSETVRHESLLDQLKIRSAFETPMLSRLPHTTTDHTSPEWGLDEPFTSASGVRNIGAPHADSKLEGADWDAGTTNYEKRVRTVCEIKHHTVEMSGTDRSSRIAGYTDTWDGRIGKKVTEHFNSIDNVLTYGNGSPELSGATAPDERQTEGMIQSAAWTGLERNHAATATMQDSYGSTIPASMYSVFQDFDHATITLASFTKNIINKLLSAGADMSDPWTFQCGYEVMSRASRFLIADGGAMLNDRNRNADETIGSDYLNTFRLSSGDYVVFRTNRWLNEGADTFTVDNTAFDHSTQTMTAPGTQTRTFSGDQTIIGHEPGCSRVLWFREPAFQDVATAGDFSKIAIVSEFAFQRDHPLCVAGAGNVLG